MPGTIIIPSLVFIICVMSKVSVIRATSNRIENIVGREAALKRRKNMNHSNEADDPWAAVGGGAVNEKKRSLEKKGGTPVRPSFSPFNPEHIKAHLTHAIEGLERYPNYLSRWNVQDMDLLERALESKLSEVRRQKTEILQRREGIASLVEAAGHKMGSEIRNLQIVPLNWSTVADKILDKGAAKAIFASRMFKHENVTVEEVIGGKVNVELDVSQLLPLMDEEMFDVYSCQLLSKQFCHRLQQFIETLIETASSDPRFAQLQIGRRPIDLDTIGLGWLADLLFHLIAKPLSRQLFLNTECGGEDLDWRQMYVAAYSAVPSETRPRNHLVTHTDDSEVTLNICLCGDFDGGELEFHGLRGSSDQGTLNDSYSPQIGKALIHAGRHFHHVTDVTRGNRYALIMWTRSWKGIRSQQCSCCWLNRRDGKTCTCGKSWN